MLNCASQKLFPFFQIPNICNSANNTSVKVATANDLISSISLEDAMSGESELCSSEPSPQVPDFLNSSMDTLKEMAGKWNHDAFIFPQ